MVQKSLNEKEINQLIVLWTSQDREVAQNMVFMYTLNSKLQGWWDKVKLIVWGPSAKLLSTDIEQQSELKKLKEAGVKLQACKACADRYDVAGKLMDMGIEVIYMGLPLTEYIQGNSSIITF